MRIGIVCHYFPPHTGGLENVAYQQALNLVNAGHQVAVLTSLTGDLDQKKIILKRVPIWNYFEQKMGVPFPIFSPSLILKAYQLVKNNDILHVHDAQYLSSLAVAFWAFVLGKPMIVTQHVAIVPHPKKIVSVIQSVVFATAARFTYAVSKKIIILNLDVHDFLIHHYVPESKIVFLPNGVDRMQFCPAKDQRQVIDIRQKYALPIDRVIALFVGRFVPKKGFSKLLECTGENYAVAFVGGNAPKPDLSKDLTFLGTLATAKVAEIYKAVDIFILPSEGEGFPLTIQEAMASGLPIITTNQPGYEIYNFDKEYIKLINSTVDEIKRSLKYLSSNAKLRQEMAAYSLDYVQKNFSWEKNVAQLQDIYHEIVL